MFAQNDELRLGGALPLMHFRWLGGSKKGWKAVGAMTVTDSRHLPMGADPNGFFVSQVTQVIIFFDSRCSAESSPF